MLTSGYWLASERDLHPLSVTCRSLRMDVLISSTHTRQRLGQVSTKVALTPVGPLS